MKFEVLLRNTAAIVTDSYASFLVIAVDAVFYQFFHGDRKIEDNLDLTILIELQKT